MNEKKQASRSEELAASIDRSEGDNEVTGVHDQLTIKFKDTIISRTAAESHGWSDQGSDNCHFGFPASDNLFIKLILPDDGGCDGLVNIVILVQCDQNDAVKEICTYPIKNNQNIGSYSVMEIEIFSWDVERVGDEIRSITA
jgi:hypothetical protein